MNCRGLKLAKKPQLLRSSLNISAYYRHANVNKLADPLLSSQGPLTIVEARRRYWTVSQSFFSSIAVGESLEAEISMKSESSDAALQPDDFFQPLDSGSIDAKDPGELSSSYVTQASSPKMQADTPSSFKKPRSTQRQHLSRKSSKYFDFDNLILQMLRSDDELQRPSSSMTESWKHGQINFENPPDRCFLSLPFVNELLKVSEGILTSSLAVHLKITHEEAHASLVSSEIMKKVAASLNGDFLELSCSDVEISLAKLKDFSSKINSRVSDFSSLFPGKKKGFASEFTHQRIKLTDLLDGGEKLLLNGLSVGNSLFLYFMSLFRDGRSSRIIFLSDASATDLIFEDVDISNGFISAFRRWNSVQSNPKVLLCSFDSNLEDSHRLEEFDSSREEEVPDAKQFHQLKMEYNFEEKNALASKDAVESIPIVPFELIADPREKPNFIEFLKKDFSKFVKLNNYKCLLAALSTLQIKHKLPMSPEAAQLQHPFWQSRSDQFTQNSLKIACILASSDLQKFEQPILDSAMEVVSQAAAANEKKAIKSEKDCLLQSQIASLSSYERQLLKCLIHPKEISVSFNDVGAQKKTKELLRELISWPLENPSMFSSGVLKGFVSGILLYGPPGTGKTMLAKAVAAESGANFLNVAISNVLDMYVGEGEKNVMAIFSLAKKLQPCVIFIDEIDALLNVRHDKQSSGKIEIINEFMSQWDGSAVLTLRMTSKGSERIIVLGATNRPQAIDHAVLRRMPRRLLGLRC